MPKARGPDVDEALEDMEEDKKWGWDDTGDWDYEGAYEGTWNVAADYVADDGGRVKALHGKVTIDENELDDCECDNVDPAVWPLLMRWLRQAPKDLTADDDDEPPFV